MATLVMRYGNPRSLIEMQRQINREHTATFSTPPAPIVASDYPRLVWAEGSDDRLATINAALAQLHAATAEPDATFTPQETAHLSRYELHERLSYLNEYGGPVSDGKWQPVPKFTPHDSPEFRRSMIQAVRLANRTHRDLRRRYRWVLTPDWHPLSFGLRLERLIIKPTPAWYFKWPAQRLKNPHPHDEYVYITSGGLICHHGGGDPLSVSLVPCFWSINT